jgi:N-acetylneuraminic acid mutarotase
MRLVSVFVLMLMAVMTGRLSAQWVEIARPDSLADRYTHASAYDPVNDRIYMIGGCGRLPRGVSLCQRYDPDRDTWETMAPMPTPRTWIGGAYIRGRIYIAGGWTENMGVNEEYNIAANEWQTRAPMPVSADGYQVAVWRDSLMYIMGGFEVSSCLYGVKTVQVYSPFTDTWTIGTSMPRHGGWGAGTIVGDTIYITGAYDGLTHRLWTEMLRGVINPADPTEITWLSGPELPLPVANQSTASLRGKIYWFGGFTADTVGSQTRKGWVYDPATGGIDSIPSLPPTVGLGLEMGSAAGREVTNELFQIAGQGTDTTAWPYHKIQLSPPSVVEESRCDVEPVTLEVRSGVAGGNVQVRYALLRSGWVRIQVQDVTGRVVRTLVSGQTRAGSYAAAWDGRDEYGRPARSGVYFCRLQAGEFTTARKMVKVE